jgi:hypothetical protein
MNQITKRPISELGYNFIPAAFIPKGKDEYYLRNIQNRSGTKYRKLTTAELKTLKANANTSNNWTHVLVSDAFNPNLVKNCAFYGLVRIGKLEPFFAEFNNLRMPVGLYNSTIISCDIGDNVVIDNVNFMSHYIVGNEAMLVNINELATTNHSKFGNGVLKKGERESVRIWMEICNENAGRSVLPFNGMLTGDAWLWSKYRDDEKLLEKFKEFTDKRFDTKRGYYGKIGDRTVIKNCGIIKDVWVGSDAYIKGANKLKNLTVNSNPDAKSQIGEGCELVNGIIGLGCRLFYGVKAVRFIMGHNSQLKYGARLINSYLGDNSTISCCEVLNSLIFPAHEQHHNNSFLCAATVMGQSNMAAGATIGSNHNSRGADGEIVAGRGFWPGLCVSLKHNSKFASFTLIAKGDFPAELNITVPFSLVSNDVSNDKLTVYALSRNAGKYISRDRRTDKTQVIEYDFLAPDSVNEMITSISLFKTLAAKAWAKKNNKKIAEQDLLQKGKQLFEKQRASIRNLEILAEGVENSPRKVQFCKLPEAYDLFQRFVIYYGVSAIIKMTEEKNISSWAKLVQSLPAKAELNQWKNIGGQLMPAAAVETLVRGIRNGKISGWDEVHAFYNTKSASYSNDRFRHAFAALLEVLNIGPAQFSKKIFTGLLKDAIATREWMTDAITGSRAKDYDNPFRKMVYETQQELEKVIGKLKENSFILQQEQETKEFSKRIAALLEKIS